MLKKIEFFVMRKITIKWLMDMIVRTKARLVGKVTIPDGESKFIKQENVGKHVHNLIENGYSILDYSLDPLAVDAIVKYSETIKCYDPYGDPEAAVDPLHAPEKTHLAHFKRKDLVNFKPILDIANDPRLLKAVQDFLGAKPTISNINMWWSFGYRKQAEHAQLFHRDFDDWRFCKLFVYLTDVSEKSGPHVYVKGSSKSPKLRKIRRYSDKEVETVFGKENVLEFVAPKGSAFVVDTYGFHKGLLPESHDRLLLQVQYSLYPIAIENYAPVEVKNVKEYDSYINRLLIK